MQAGIISNETAQQHVCYNRNKNSGPSLTLTCQWFAAKKSTFGVYNSAWHLSCWAPYSRSEIARMAWFLCTAQQ